MYTEQLEQLIKSVIADGVITEKERAVLHKKAAAEGVDEDEIDVYVDGLIAQMEPVTKQNKKFDLKYVNKYKKDNDIVFVGKNLYRVHDISIGRIQELYLSFFKREGKEEHFGICVIIVYKEGMRNYYSHPRLLLNTQTCDLDLEEGKEWVNVPAQVKSSKRGSHVFCFELDADMLKSICESNKIFLSLIGLRVTDEEDWDDDESIDFNKIVVHDLSTYAQIFYRSIIDNTSYQNAELDSDLLAAISKGNEGLLNNDRTLTLLMTPQKKLKKLDVGHNYFKQFILPEPGLQLIEFDERHSIGSWSDYIRIYSIIGKGKTEFFLKVAYDYRVDIGRDEPVKKQVDFNDGYFRIVCDANSDIKVAPLMTEHPLYEVKDADTEINFYRISVESVRKMIEAEDLSFSIYGGKETIEDIRHTGFSAASPFVWKQAFATLMGEDVPQKKSLFGKIKGLFK